MEVFAPRGRVRGLPAALGIEHLDRVHDQDVIVRARIPGPARGVPGVREHQPAGRGGHGGLAAAAAHRLGQRVEIRHRAVPFRVHDPVHVRRPAHHPELGDRLVRRDDQLHARPLRRGEPCPGYRVMGAAWAEQVLVVLGADVALETEPGRAGAAPRQRGLAPLGVVAEGLALVVVAALDDGLAVVFDRVRSHHPHPGHGCSPLSFR